MKQLIVKLAAIVFLAAALIPIVGISTATTAGACGWYPEVPPWGANWTNPQSAQSSSVWNSYGGHYTRAQVNISVYNDGCHNRYYYFTGYYVYQDPSSGHWVYDYVPGLNVTQSNNVWVCGPLREHNVVNRADWWSGTYSYQNSPWPDCGPQAAIGMDFHHNSYITQDLNNVYTNIA